MVEVAPQKAGPQLESVKADEGSAVSSKTLAPKITSAPPIAIPADEQDHKVVHIVRHLRDDAGEVLVHKKRPWVLLSVLVCVALPTLLASIFYLFIVADRYSSRVAFVVRSAEGRPADLSESFVVADFVSSPEMVRQLDQRLPLRPIFSSDRADFASRLESDASFEKLAGYWHGLVDTYYDSTKSTISVEVQAFTPEDAFKVATETLNVVSDLVSNLGLQSRRDALEAATSVVVGAEARAQEARRDLLAYQQAQADLEATTPASSGSQIPVASEPAASAEATVASMATLEVLRIKQEFADKAYRDALAGLEQARADAGRATSYLAVFAQPSQPEEAAYPRRGFNILIVLVLSGVIWAVGALSVLTIRDHMP